MPPRAAGSEMDRWARLELEDLHSTDVLESWRALRVQFPVLARVARCYLPIQPSSASVERIFSTGGVIVTKRRCDTIEDLVLVHDNRDMLRYILEGKADPAPV